MLMAMSFMRGIGPVALRKVSRIPNFLNFPIDDIAELVPAVGKALQYMPNAWTNALEAASHQLDLLETHFARVLSPLDNEYPLLLAATKDDPFLIFVKGALPPDPRRSIAIIGTREPTVHGQKTATRIATFCADQGWSVVSGLAIGCDGIAHRAALDAGGHTIAVLAHGLQMVAPTRHEKLAQSILDAGGALMSQFRFGTKVMPQQYVQRDRVQAGLAQGVVMIQSDVKGGSLHAARAAIEYQRWLAVPYPTSSDRDHKEPKVQANLIIAEGEESNKSMLLRCAPPDLDRVIVLRSRESYSLLTDLMQFPQSIRTLENVAP